MKGWKMFFSPMNVVLPIMILLFVWLAPTAVATDFTLPPSVTTSTIGAGVRMLNLLIFCVDFLTGEISPNCNVQLTHAPELASGGHNHDANRPTGTFTPDAGNTGADGFLAVTYTAPEVSGIIETTITGSLQDGTPLIPGVFTIGVRIDGLEPLPNGANYTLVGSTARHPDNHFGIATFNNSLITLANNYAAAFPGQLLSYNDMSLAEGGLFDINGNWGPPHVSHRFGMDGDLALVPLANRNRLRQLIRAAGIATLIVEGNHWHVRQ